MKSTEVQNPRQGSQHLILLQECTSLLASRSDPSCRVGCVKKAMQKLSDVKKRVYVKDQLPTVRPF